MTTTSLDDGPSCGPRAETAFLALPDLPNDWLAAAGDMPDAPPSDLYFRFLLWTRSAPPLIE